VSIPFTVKNLQTDRSAPDPTATGLGNTLLGSLFEKASAPGVQIYSPSPNSTESPGVNYCNPSDPINVRIPGYCKVTDVLTELDRPAGHSSEIPAKGAWPGKFTAQSFEGVPAADLALVPNTVSHDGGAQPRPGLTLSRTGPPGAFPRICRPDRGAEQTHQPVGRT
jgi:hypothetical protein